MEREEQEKERFHREYRRQGSSKETCVSLPHNLTGFLAENASGVIHLLSLRETYIPLPGLAPVFLSVVRLP